MSSTALPPSLSASTWVDGGSFQPYTKWSTSDTPAESNVNRPGTPTPPCQRLSSW